MEKIKITNIAAVGIIYRAFRPDQIFLEMKDGGHPIKLVRHQLCFIGGNWIGEAAKQDGNTLATFRRELNEELSFERQIRNSAELTQMGMAEAATFAPTPSSGVLVTYEDHWNLKYLKNTICRSAVAFGDYMNTVPKSALDAADPGNTRDGFTSLASYWTIGLNEDDWHALRALQKKFGNLSSESITMVTSLDEIVRTGTNTAFAHDRVLRRFFLANDLVDANFLPLVPGLKSVPAGMPLPSYTAYLERYDVERTPPPF